MLREAAEAFLSPQISRPDLAAEAYNELSTLLSNQLRTDDALSAAQRSLQLTLQHNPAPGALADAYEALGLAKHHKSDFAGARAAYAEALTLSREAHGPQSLETAYVLHNIAGLLRVSGDYKGAETYYRQAMNIKLRHGKNTVTVHNSQQGLARALSAQGRFAEAADLQRQSVRLAEALYGRDSERSADSEMKLAMVLQQAGDYAGAGEHYRDALDITERVLGRTSLDYAVVATQQAALEEARGDYAAAEALYREALQIRREKLPPGDSERLSNEAYWGRALLRMGRTEEARAPLSAALPAWLDFFEPGDTAPEYVAARLVQAEWLLHEGRLDEAEAALPTATDDAPAAAIKRQALAAALAERRGDRTRALSIWRDVIERASAHVGPDSAPTAQWRASYAQALFAAGQSGPAMEQLRRAEPPLRKSMVPDADVLRQLDRLKADLRRKG
ncbi:tetratricopeptide repeat protein [Luteimonas sp. SX5]|uniref:Tetratricopeptide repeat protein n=2 Tax=Luteimonas galliterrae TaxID=2940486 RepID=A0ABT0MLN1_9GAMM|nr:tetratricopeptide repeat protein [Luteimonas galliterrae]